MFESNNLENQNTNINDWQTADVIIGNSLHDKDVDVCLILLNSIHMYMSFIYKREKENKIKTLV